MRIDRLLFQNFKMKKQNSIYIKHLGNLNIINLKKNIIMSQKKSCSGWQKDLTYKSEFPHVPIPEQSFSKIFCDSLLKHASNNPKKPAMINGNNENDSVTFKELFDYSNSVASFLCSNGFNHSDVCTLVVFNCWEYITLLTGISLCGGITSGVSPAYTEYELKRQFTDSQCKVVVCNEETMDTVGKAIETLSNVKLLIVISKTTNSLSNLLSCNKSLKVVTFDEVVKYKPNSKSLPMVNIKPKEDTFILPYSSGTTGAPKGVIISHYNFNSIQAVITAHFKNYINPFLDKNHNYLKENQLCILPFYHIFGLGITINYLLNGSTVIVTKTYEPHSFCKNIEKYKPKILMVVPPILLFLAKSPIVEKYDLSSVKITFSGAAPLGQEVCEQLKKRFPFIKYCLQGYGMTEVSVCGVISVCDEKNTFDKVGKLVANMELKILDTKTNKKVGAGKVGEVYLRGPNVMLGYFNNLEATAETIDKEGWLKTGDIGFLDEDGFLSIVDRSKELIKVQGYQVAPSELEDILLSHPDVSDAAVIGVPNETAGELPKAFIVPKNNSLAIADIQNFLNERVVYYKRLKGGIEFVSEIPKSASGKILRRLLKDRSN